MKRLLVTLLMVLVLFYGVAFGASTVVQTNRQVNHDRVMVTLTVTAHTNGSVTSTAIDPTFDGIDLRDYDLYQVYVDPGATAPTPNYDVTLTDEDSIDLMKGQLANLHTSTSEWRYPPVVSQPYPTTLTLNVANNSQNGAITVLYLYFFKTRSN